MNPNNSLLLKTPKITNINKKLRKIRMILAKTKIGLNKTRTLSSHKKFLRKRNS
jgi:hypothetical protein